MGIGIPFAAVQFLISVSDKVYQCTWHLLAYHSISCSQADSQHLGLHVKLDVDMHINMTEWWFT